MTTTLIATPIRNKPAFLSFDTLDDRREVLRLLARLPPRRRIAFHRWCCKQVEDRAAMRTFETNIKTVELADVARWDSSADEMLTQEVYKDVFYFAGQWGLDLDVATKRLVEMVRASGRV